MGLISTSLQKENYGFAVNHTPLNVFGISDAVEILQLLLLECYFTKRLDARLNLATSTKQEQLDAEEHSRVILENLQTSTQPLFVKEV